MKILVIDDSESIRFLMEEILKKKHQVITANHGKEGIEIFEKNHDFDLVITDRNMPGGMLGEEVIRRVKLSNPKIKAVLMSSQDEEEIAQIAMAAGADTTLNKSFLFDVESIIQNLFPALPR